MQATLTRVSVAVRMPAAATRAFRLDRFPYPKIVRSPFTTLPNGYEEGQS
jgi:hypothetical protein